MIEEADKLLFPIIQASAYTNWKLNDRDLIRNIPFILTYDPDLHLMIPLIIEGGKQLNASGLFENVAAALMLNPAFITYVVDDRVLNAKPQGYIDAAASDFAKSLLYALKIMDMHGLQTHIRILVLRSNGAGKISAELILRKNCRMLIIL